MRILIGVRSIACVPQSIKPFEARWRYAAFTRDFDALDVKAVKHNLQLAFDVAEKVGIPKLLEVDDVANFEVRSGSTPPRRTRSLGRARWAWERERELPSSGVSWVLAEARLFMQCVPSRPSLIWIMAA